jgi:hypothetical protein
MSKLSLQSIEAAIFDADVLQTMKGFADTLSGMQTWVQQNQAALPHLGEREFHAGIFDADGMARVGLLLRLDDALSIAEQALEGVLYWQEELEGERQRRLSRGIR